MKSWRDVYPVHPSADVFPLMTKDELQELAGDIKKNGLQSKVTMWQDGAIVYLLDGRNRLDAMELAGRRPLTNGKLDESYTGSYLTSLTFDPAAVVISANIRRRHLLKRQQAALIVKAVKAGKETHAKPARVSRKATDGARGPLKDPVKEQVLKEAAKQGISERTATQALVDAEPGRKRQAKPDPKQKPRGRKQNAPQAVRADDVAKNVLQAAQQLRKVSEHLSADGIASLSKARQILVEIDPTSTMKKAS